MAREERNGRHQILHDYTSASSHGARIEVCVLMGKPHDSPDEARKALAAILAEHRREGCRVDEANGKAEHHTADTDTYHQYSIVLMEEIPLTE